MARVKRMHDKDADQCIRVSVKHPVKDPKVRITAVSSALDASSDQRTYLIGVVDSGSVEVWCNCRLPRAPVDLLRELLRARG